MTEMLAAISKAQVQYAKEQDVDFENCINKHYNLTLAALLRHPDKYLLDVMPNIAASASKRMAAYEFKMHEYFKDGKSLLEWFEILQKYNSKTKQNLPLFQTLNSEDFTKLVEFKSEVK